MGSLGSMLSTEGNKPISNGVFLKFSKKWFFDHWKIFEAMEKMNSVDFLNSLADTMIKGEVLGKSRWLEISQVIIDNFADATFDHQWIHTDPKRAKVDSPYKTTIAHGYLTLSLLPSLLDDIIETFKSEVEE